MTVIQIAVTQIPAALQILVAVVAVAALLIVKMSRKIRRQLEGNGL